MEEVFGLRVVPSETEADATLQTRKQRHERVRETVEHNLFNSKMKGAGQKRERMDSRRRKKTTRNDCKRLWEEFEVGGSMAQTGC